VGGRGERVFGIVQHPDRDVHSGQCVDEGVDRPIAERDHGPRLPVDTRVAVEFDLTVHSGYRVFSDFDAWLYRCQVGVRAELPHLLRGDLAARVVGVPLDHTGELDLQPARQVEVVLGLHDVGHAALAGLRVDPDDRLVGAPDILRVDRQVGYRPGEV